MKKIYRKVLAILLSLAMVVTTFAFYDAKVKADPIALTVNVALESGNANQLHVTWTNPSEVVSGQGYTFGYYVDSINTNNQCKAANGWVWSRDNPTEIRTYLDTVSGTNGGVDFRDGGDFTIIVVIYHNGDVYAQGTSSSIHIDPDQSHNYDAQFKLDRYESGSDYLNTVCSWQTITGASTYRMINVDTGTVLATSAGVWEQWHAPVSSTPGDTYTCRIIALDSQGQQITITNNEITLNCYYEQPTENYDAKFKLDRYVPGTHTNTVVSWQTITGVNSYRIYNKDTGELLASPSAGDVWTQWNAPTSTIENDTYTCQIVALNSSGNAINISNDEISLNYDLEVAPSEHTSADFSQATWMDLEIKGTDAGSVTDTYQINTDHGFTNLYYFGIYCPHTSIPYHEQRDRCIINGNVFSFTESNVSSVWINGHKHNNYSTTFNNQGDCGEISVDVFQPGINVITLVFGDDSTHTFAIKVAGGTSHTITIDGVQVGSVFHGKKYIFPGYGMTQYTQYGYYQTSDNTKVYAPGDEITVNSDLVFTGIDTLTFTHTNGATIHMVKSEPGIAFRATVSMNNSVPIFNNSFNYGTIITTRDFFIDTYDENLILDNSSNQAHVSLTSTSQWVNGTYTIGVLNVKQQNFTRNFVSRAYCKINYTSGHSKVFYATNPTDTTNRSRSIAQVAKSMKAATSYYNSLEESEKQAVDYFASFE